MSNQVKFHALKQAAEAALHHARMVGKVAVPVVLAGALTACGHYRATTQGGVVVEGFTSPVFSSTKVVGLDQGAASANEVAALRVSPNPNLQRLGECAADFARGSTTGNRIAVAEELDAERAAAMGRAPANRPAGC